MRLMCELYRKLVQNTSILQGKCYEKPINSPYSNKTNFVKTFNDIIIKNEPVDLAASSKEDREAAMYIVVVICFFSLSIMFMVILNVKFKIVFDRQGCCYEMAPSHDLYDQQQEETKKAINLLFSNSSRLVSSITTIAPGAELNDPYDFSRKKSIKSNTSYDLNSSFKQKNLQPSKNQKNLNKLTIV